MSSQLLLFVGITKVRLWQKQDVSFSVAAVKHHLPQRRQTVAATRTITLGIVVAGWYATKNHSKTNH